MFRSLKSLFVYSRARFALVLSGIVLLSFALPDGKKIKVYLVGDSTMCLYDKTRFPQEGWGMPFANYFDSTITIDNRARGGRSSKSFIAENLWQPIVNDLHEGDYVLVQFGHNDAANSKDHPNRSTTIDEYKQYLATYIKETRSKKANPILLTPVAKRKFDKDGKAEEVHAPYLKAVQEVAAEYKVPVIDLDTRGRELLQKLGPDFSRYLYMDFEPNEHPLFPAGFHDNTHFTDFGARKMAEIVVKEMKDQKLELADHLVKRGGPR